jgi:hypothetical protein
MEGCIRFLEGKLKLKVNRKKSVVGKPRELKFLGFSFYWSKEGVRIRVHGKTLRRLWERLKASTNRKRSGAIEAIREEITVLVQGWLGYHSIADMKAYLERLSAWLRRQVYWERWKRVRYEEQTKLGVNREQS